MADEGYKELSELFPAHAGVIPIAIWTPGYWAALPCAYGGDS